MSILITALLAVWMIVALLMILVILMQRPKSEGLGAAFGGGVTENIFGAQTTNVLVKFTGYLAAAFFLLTFILSILYARRAASTNTGLRQELMKTQAAPTASVVPGTAQPSPAAAAASASPNPAASPGASASPVAPPTNVQVQPSAAPSASAMASPSASAKP